MPDRDAFLGIRWDEIALLGAAIVNFLVLVLA